LVFNNLIICYGHYRHPQWVDTYNVTVTYPQSYSNVPSVNVSSASGQPQVNICVGDLSITQFKIVTSPDYGNNYGQQEACWIAIGY